MRVRKPWAEEPCADVRQVLHLFAEGEVPDFPTRDRVAVHVRRCAGCRLYLKRYDDVTRALLVRGAEGFRGATVDGWVAELESQERADRAMERILYGPPPPWVEEQPPTGTPVACDTPRFSEMPAEETVAQNTAAQERGWARRELGVSALPRQFPEASWSPRSTNWCRPAGALAALVLAACLLWAWTGLPFGGSSSGGSQLPAELVRGAVGVGAIDRIASPARSPRLAAASSSTRSRPVFWALGDVDPGVAVSLASEEVLMDLFGFAPPPPGGVARGTPAVNVRAVLGREQHRGDSRSVLLVPGWPAGSPRQALFSPERFEVREIVWVRRTARTAEVLRLRDAARRGLDHRGLYRVRSPHATAQMPWSVRIHPARLAPGRLGARLPVPELEDLLLDGTRRPNLEKLSTAPVDWRHGYGRLSTEL